MTLTVRFAPSPTGNIHIGNARTALFNWLFAKTAGARFILRFDDTDVDRSKQEYADQIEKDLAWLGITPDLMLRQSDRLDIYNDAIARLKAAGRLYPCYETQEELDLKRKVLASRRLPPVYGREALTLTGKQKAAFEAEGRKPHWRFLLPNFRDSPLKPSRHDVQWTDLVRGRETVDLASLSDPVLVRADGSVLYTLTSVVDDIDLGISHIIRGDDHVTNTGVQIALFEALGTKAPELGHHNLLTAASGEGLSKRTGALSIASLAADGVEPMAVASLAVLIGTSENVIAAKTMEELAGHFSLADTSKSAAKFDPADVLALNRMIVHAMPFAAAEARLAEMGISGEKAEAFWLAVRGNCAKVAEAADWWAIVKNGPDTPIAWGEGEQDFARAAFDLLPPEPWSRETFGQWANAVKTATGAKGKALFMPLRLALTGRMSGPELADLLPLLGREETLARRP